MTKDFTQGQLQPAAQAIADQAMPTAKKITDETLRPTAQAIAEQVSLRETEARCELTCRSLIDSANQPELLTCVVRATASCFVENACAACRLAALAHLDRTGMIGTPALCVERSCGRVE